MFKKIIIVGTCGCGKTTLGKKLSKLLHYPYTDIDDLYWLPGWKKRDDAEILQKITKITENDSWILAGNNTPLKKHIWPQADVIIWIDLPLHTLLYRVVRRSITNIWYKRPLCNGNYETLRLLFSRNSIVIWVLSSYWRRKNSYGELFSDTSNSNRIRIRSSKSVQKIVTDLKNGHFDLKSLESLH